MDSPDRPNEPTQTRDATHTTPSIPTYRSREWSTGLRRMVDTSAPRRFSVIGHDDATENSAILAWGFDYGDGDVIVESARDDRRWSVNSPTAVNQYFRCPDTGSIEIYWIDQPT